MTPKTPRNIAPFKPTADSLDLRANVAIKPGPTADAVRALAVEYQMDPASVIRMLVVDGLRLRKVE